MSCKNLWEDSRKKFENFREKSWRNPRDFFFEKTLEELVNQSNEKTSKFLKLWSSVWRSSEFLIIWRNRWKNFWRNLWKIIQENARRDSRKNSRRNIWISPWKCQQERYLKKFLESTLEEFIEGTQGKFHKQSMQDFQ